MARVMSHLRKSQPVREEYVFARLAVQRDLVLPHFIKNIETMAPLVYTPKGDANSLETSLPSRGAFNSDDRGHKTMSTMALRRRARYCSDNGSRILALVILALTVWEFYR